MNSQSSGRIAVWGGILVLATLLIGLSLTPAIQELVMRSQVRNCGVVGFIAFVGLSCVARVCHGMADAPLEEREHSAASAAR